MEHTIRRVDVPAEDMRNIFGYYDHYIRKVESDFNVTIVDRDGFIKIAGEEQAVHRAENIVRRKCNPGAECGLRNYDGNGK